MNASLRSMLRLSTVKRALRRARSLAQARARKTPSVTEFWTDFNVTEHARFRSREESLDYLDWRSEQYFDYLRYMPLAGHDRKSILDYGCGPGHDLMGFGHFSRPSRLVGADVSPTSLEETRARLALHGIEAELVRVDEHSARLPFPDASFDYVASSGVLHHIRDPLSVIKELRRVIKPNGEMRIMVYNYDSIFLHLHTAYLVRIKERRLNDRSLQDAFRELTDAPGCPVSRTYRPDEFIALAGAAGFRAVHLGNAVSAYEAQIVPLRFEAIQQRRLPFEHRSFLRELRLDDRGLPYYRGNAAGLDGCYRMAPI